MNESDYLRKLECVDVRGAEPVYVNGMRCMELPGKSRDITIEDARIVVEQLSK